MSEHPLDDSAKPVEGLYYPTPVTPEEAYVAIGKLRKAARAEIERLIDWLDSTDNHMEREQDGDEADASYPESGSRMCTPGEDDEATGDEDEPSLGSVEDHPNGYLDGSDVSGRGRSQERWGAGSMEDCEGDEHDGAEPEDEDDEHDGREPDREDTPAFPELVDQTVTLYGLPDFAGIGGVL